MQQHGGSSLHTAVGGDQSSSRIPTNDHHSHSDNNNHHSDQHQLLLEDNNKQPKIPIKLLSYNVFMRPLVKTNQRGDFKDARLIEIIAKIKEEQFDIICLQELFSTLSSWRMQQLLNEFIPLGFQYVHLSRNLYRFKPIDSGLIILSRFPIVERDSFIFSQGSHIDGYSTKGVMSVLLDVSNNNSNTSVSSSSAASAADKKYLLVFNTHTQANYDLNDESYWKVQQSQVNEISIFIHKKMKQFVGIPALVCGDFNIDARNKPEWYDWMMNSLNQINDQSTMERLQQEFPLDISELQGTPLTADSNSTTLKEQLSEQRNLVVTDLVLQQEAGYHPISFGDVIVKNDRKEEAAEEIPREVILTNPHTLLTKERLDYIFHIGDDENSSSPPHSHSGVLSVQKCYVEPFFRPSSEITEEMPCTQLSDHYAVSLSATLS